MGVTSFISNVSTTFYFCACWNCGVVYGITKELDQRRRKDGKSVYCPNGHVGVYTSEEEDYKKKLEEEKRARIEAQGELEVEKGYTKKLKDRNTTLKREKAAVRGVVTKIKKRIGNGVCPCCNRTFVNLSRHMKGQHPHFNKGSK